MIHVLTCSGCPRGRGSHVSQADVRGAAAHHSSDPGPHWDHCNRCRWGFIQVLCQRHYCSHQVWQVNLLCKALIHTILHCALCEQQNWCILISLNPSTSAFSLTDAHSSCEACQLRLRSQSVLHLWPLEIWTLTFYKLILTHCSFLSIWEFILITHDAGNIPLSAGSIS